MKVINILVVVLFMECVLFSQQDEEKKHVLFINSYANGYAWGDSITKGIKSIFHERDDVHLYIEYLDSKQYGKTLFNYHKELLEAKYEQRKVDVIIASDNNALDFVLNNLDLSMEVPIVFCGINNPEDYKIDQESIYGIKEGDFYKESFDVILEMLPETNTLYFIYDSSETSLVDIRKMHIIEKEYFGRVGFKYVYSRDLRTLLKKVDKFDKNGVIADFHIALWDKLEMINPDEAIAVLTSASPIPVFGVGEVALGKGVVGGVYNNGVLHGKEAANLALKFIDTPNYIPKEKVLDQEGKYVFDYGELMELNIDLDKLPEQSLIINIPNSQKKYLKYIIVLFSFVVFQILIITLLIRNTLLRRKAEKELVEKYGQIRNKNEELEKAKAEAQKSDQLKTEFLNNMSHEIRTPMNGIMGFSQILEDGNVSDKNMRYYSRIIRNSSVQLLKIIDDILVISNLEKKQVNCIQEMFDLNAMLDELYSIFSLKAKDADLKIHLIKGVSYKPFLINSDKSHIVQILSNLIENALKFTAEGFVEVGYTASDNLLKLYVKDTGIGISPENLEMIFKRFSQEEKEMSKKYGGLGLGLSISKESAKLLGGEISVESEKGKGTTFFLTLPYQPVGTKNNEANSKFNNKKLADRKFTVLVADDEEINYLYLETLFEQEKDNQFILVHALTGKEAVEICQTNADIDIVLMDIKMPEMNGHEATEKIKSQFPDLPVIAQTAYSTQADKDLALKYGCDDILIKPINKKVFFDKIHAYLQV